MPGLRKPVASASCGALVSPMGAGAFCARARVQDNLAHTTIDPSHDRMVQRAVKLIDQRVADRDAALRHLITPSTLVVRGTTRG